MDATFRTKVLPERETSREAHEFVLSPGGKGLTQAVAATRLGLDVSLLAAVADDRFGQEIVHYLRHEGVDTSMLKVVSDARTPFTGVIEFELGYSIAVNWRNEREVRLDIRDIDRYEPELGYGAGHVHRADFSFCVQGIRGGAGRILRGPRRKAPRNRLRVLRAGRALGNRRHGRRYRRLSDAEFDAGPAPRRTAAEPVPLYRRTARRRRLHQR